MKQTSIILISSVALLFSTSCTAKKDKPKTKLPVPVKVAKAQQKDVQINPQWKKTASCLS
jgi:hypothetical protein